MLFSDSFHYFLCRSAAGRIGRSQYKYSLDRSLLRIFAGEQKAQYRYIFQNRDTTDYTKLYGLSNSADYETFTRTNTSFFARDFPFGNDWNLLYTIRSISCTKQDVGFKGDGTIGKNVGSDFKRVNYIYIVYFSLGKVLAFSRYELSYRLQRYMLS